jgi:hypothetical protein
MIATRTDPELKEMFDRIHQASSLARGGGGDHKVGPVPQRPFGFTVHTCKLNPPVNLLALKIMLAAELIT